MVNTNQRKTQNAQTAHAAPHLFRSEIMLDVNGMVANSHEERLGRVGTIGTEPSAIHVHDDGDDHCTLQ